MCYRQAFCKQPCRSLLGDCPFTTFSITTVCKPLSLATAARLQSKLAYLQPVWLLCEVNTCHWRYQVEPQPGLSPAGGPGHGPATLSLHSAQIGSCQTGIAILLQCTKHQRYQRGSGNIDGNKQEIQVQPAKDTNSHILALSSPVWGSLSQRNIIIHMASSAQTLVTSLHSPAKERSEIKIFIHT